MQLNSVIICKSSNYSVDAVETKAYDRSSIPWINHVIAHRIKFVDQSSSHIIDYQAISQLVISDASRNRWISSLPTFLTLLGSRANHRGKSVGPQRGHCVPRVSGEVPESLLRAKALRKMDFSQQPLYGFDSFERQRDFLNTKQRPEDQNTDFGDVYFSCLEFPGEKIQWMCCVHRRRWQIHETTLRLPDTMTSRETAHQNEELFRVF